MSGEENEAEGASPYWNSDEADYESCDCPGPPPPPQFVIPPPPPPPSLHLCRGGEHLSELQHCHMEPVGAEYTQAAFPSLPIIAVCSSVVLVAILVASFLLWKHKKKVQNFFPCKADHQGRCDISSSNGVTYDDVLINHHPTRLPAHHGSDTHTLTPIELLDVKYVSYVQHHLEALNFAPPHKDNARSHKNKEHFNPIYEEVSGGSDDKVGSRSYDSDIEDSEVEARTVASEDEFAEDELSVAEAPRDESQPYSGTSSMQGSTGGHLYPDIASGSSERFSSDGSNSDTRAFKELLRRSDGEGKAHASKKQHSLERNKDRNTLQAKHNYYLNKIMLGPDLAYPDVTNGTDLSRSGSGSQRDSGVPYSGNSMDLDIGHSPPTAAENAGQYPRTLGSLNVSAILHPAGALLASARSSPPPPPYTTRASPGSAVREGISALYNPHAANPPSLTSSASTTTSSASKAGGGGRVPAEPPLLSELTFKFPATGTRSLPGPHCRGGTILFAGDNPPYSPQHHHHQHLHQQQHQSSSSSSSRGRSGSASEFLSFHPYPGGRPPTPPPAENIYASIEDDGSGTCGGGPFTIDGGRHRGPFSSSSRKVVGGLKAPFIRAGPLMRPLVPRESGKSAARGQVNHIPLQREMTESGMDNKADPEDPGTYGDIRPVYDSRTACT